MSELEPLPPREQDLVVLTRCAQCGTLAQPYRVLCDLHWGEQQLEAARAKIRAGALTAVETLIDIAETSTDPERVRAANSILDRCGLRQGVDLTVAVATPAVSPSEVLRQRLDVLRRRHAEDDMFSEELPESHDGGENSAQNSGAAE